MVKPLCYHFSVSRSGAVGKRALEIGNSFAGATPRSGVWYEEVQLSCYAIIQTGGKQYKVEVGSQILVEKLEAEVNAEVAFETLLVADDSGVKVGKPI